MSTFGRQRAEVFDKAHRAQYWRDNFSGLTAFERHTKLIQDVLASNGGKAPSNASADTAAAAAGAAGPSAAALHGIRTDADALREQHRFIRTAADDAAEGWEARLARKYYERLFKEYAIADLSRYKQGQIGLRWRTHAEVVSGKGQFICGARGCDERASLASFEVPFAYKEAGQHKQALVKLRLCPRCAAKLNHKRSRGDREVQRHQRRQEREERRKRSKRSSAGADGQDREQQDSGQGAGQLGKRRRSGGGEEAHARHKRRRRGDGGSSSAEEQEEEQQQRQPKEEEHGRSGGRSKRRRDGSHDEQLDELQHCSKRARSGHEQELHEQELHQHQRDAEHVGLQSSDRRKRQRAEGEEDYEEVPQRKKQQVGGGADGKAAQEQHLDADAMQDASEPAQQGRQHTKQPHHESPDAVDAAAFLTSKRQRGCSYEQARQGQDAAGATAASEQRQHSSKRGREEEPCKAQDKRRKHSAGRDSSAGGAQLPASNADDAEFEQLLESMFA